MTDDNHHSSPTAKLTAAMHDNPWLSEHGLGARTNEILNQNASVTAKRARILGLANEVVLA